MRSSGAFVIAALIPVCAGADTALPSLTLPTPLARVLADYETAWQNKDAAALAGRARIGGLLDSLWPRSSSQP